MIFFPKKNKLPDPKPNSDFVPPSQVVEPKKHEHHWQDFPPYIVYHITDSKYEIKIIEPYICLDCKERKEVVLLQLAREGYHVYNEGEEQVRRLEKKYEGFIKDHLIVEDMINDVINVDSEYNKYWRLIHGIKNPNGTDEFDLKPRLTL